MTIRPATADDYAAFVRLFDELGIPDPVPTAERFAAALVPVMSVACVDGNVVGFVTWRSYGALAHVMQVVVDAAVRGRRIGDQLLRCAADQARAAGCTRWYLNVKRDNAPAIRLYERVGMTFELEAFALKLDWARLPRIDVHEELASPDDDPAIAAVSSVPLERIAMFRGRNNRMIVLREGTAIVGFAPFDPSFPGTPTTWAVRPALAHALLEAIRHHADPAYDFVRITVEGDRPLAEAFLALGAESTFEILRLSGDLDRIP